VDRARPPSTERQRKVVARHDVMLTEQVLDRAPRFRLGSERAVHARVAARDNDVRFPEDGQMQCIDRDLGAGANDLLIDDEGGDPRDRDGLIRLSCDDDRLAAENQVEHHRGAAGAGAGRLRRGGDERRRRVCGARGEQVEILDRGGAVDDVRSPGRTGIHGSRTDRRRNEDQEQIGRKVSASRWEIPSIRQDHEAWEQAQNLDASTIGSAVVDHRSLCSSAQRDDGEHEREEARALDQALVKHNQPLGMRGAARIEVLELIVTAGRAQTGGQPETYTTISGSEPLGKQSF